MTLCYIPNNTDSHSCLWLITMSPTRDRVFPFGYQQLVCMRSIEDEWRTELAN